MSFEQSVSHKSREELDASAQAKRDEVIKNYTDTLDGLEKQIKAAKIVLEGLNKDTDKLHANRLKEYEGLEQRLKSVRDDLALQHKSLDQQRISFDEQCKAHGNHNECEFKKITDAQTSLRAKEDQLMAMEKELNEYAAIQVETGNKQADTEQTLKTRCAELDQHILDANKLTEQIIADHHKLKGDVAAHQVNIDSHIEAVKELEAREQKNLEFYNAILAREADILPLKKKYEDGIEANEKEAQRLRDANLESYATKREADQRLKTAIEAEQRVKTDIEILENLKNDLYTQLKKEK